jgi:hypothetical protein
MDCMSRAVVRLNPAEHQGAIPDRAIILSREQGANIVSLGGLHHAQPGA